MTDNLGHCPICRKPLEKNGVHLVCPAGDFTILESVFDAAWAEYTAGDLQDNQKAKKLVRTLKSKNIQNTRTKP